MKYRASLMKVTSMHCKVSPIEVSFVLTNNTSPIYTKTMTLLTLNLTFWSMLTKIESRTWATTNTMFPKRWHHTKTNCNQSLSWKTTRATDRKIKNYKWNCFSQKFNLKSVPISQKSKRIQSPKSMNSITQQCRCSIMARLSQITKSLKT